MSGFSLANAKKNGVAALNTMLHKKCSAQYHFDLKLYKDIDIENTAVYNETMDYDIMLCLFYKNRCISSVAANYNKEKKEVEIISKTMAEYEGKKFNLYLRFAFIFLMTLIRPTIKTVVSYSVNPISTYTMFKYFGASNQDLTDFVATNQLTRETFTLENAKAFHQYYIDKHKHTWETAKEEVEEMLEYDTLENLGFENEESAIQFVMETSNPKTILLEIVSPIDAMELDSYQQSLLEKMDNIMIVCDPPSIQDMHSNTRKRKRTNGGRTRRKNHKNRSNRRKKYNK